MNGEKFRFICYLNTKLWSQIYDVCGRPLFANPVTHSEYTIGLFTSCAGLKNWCSDGGSREQIGGTGYRLIMSGDEIQDESIPGNYYRLLTD